MIFSCPGSQRFKQPSPEMVRCSHCGEEAELWSDEFEVRCGKCKKAVIRRPVQSCLDWCKYAKECVGVIKKGGR